MKSEALPQARKLCASCATEKDREDFYVGGSGRLRSRCKACYAKHNKEQRAKHREKRDAYDAARGPGWERSGRLNYELSPDQKHESHLVGTYGISLADYERLLKEQGGVCAICRQHCNRSTTGRFNVDHDHATGQVRGLLCFKCNTGLGRFNDDPAMLEEAARYLRRAQSVERKRIFVCGPMSGLAKMNYPAFNLRARQLRALGHIVENPAENPIPPGGAWVDYMRMSITQVTRCDSVYLLPGWEKSRGASLEVHIARALGLEVIEP